MILGHLLVHCSGCRVHFSKAPEFIMSSGTERSELLLSASLESLPEARTNHARQLRARALQTGIPSLSFPFSLQLTGQYQYQSLLTNQAHDLECITYNLAALDSEQDRILPRVQKRRLSFTVDLFMTTCYAGFWTKSAHVIPMIFVIVGWRGTSEAAFLVWGEEAWTSAMRLSEGWE